MNRKLFSGLLMGGIAMLSLAGCGSTPASVIPGTSLVQFQNKVAGWLRTAPFNVTKIGSVGCALPAKWTPGVKFVCFVESSDPTAGVIGIDTITITSTQPGYEWDVETSWCTEACS